MPNCLIKQSLFNTLSVRSERKQSKRTKTNKPKKYVGLLDFQFWLDFGWWGNMPQVKIFTESMRRTFCFGFT